MLSTSKELGHVINLMNQQLGVTIFYALNGDIYQVPFIDSWDDRYWYASSKGFKILSLPYEKYWENYWNRNNTKERFAMYLFLPDAKDGLLDLLGQFSSNPDLLNLEFKFDAEELRRVSVYQNSSSSISFRSPG